MKEANRAHGDHSDQDIRSLLSGPSILHAGPTLDTEDSRMIKARWHRSRLAALETEHPKPQWQRQMLREGPQAKPVSPAAPLNCDHVFRVCFCSVKPGDDGLLSTTDLTSSLPPAFPEKFQHFKEKRQATCGLIFELLSVPQWWEFQSRRLRDGKPPS